MINNNVKSLKSTIIALLGREPRSLADLQVITQVSLPTLRQATQELKEGGWICPVGRRSSTGGRRATLYGLNGKSHIIIGIHLEVPALTMVVSGLDGQVIDRVHLSNADELRPDQAIKLISNYVRQVQAKFSDRRLLGIGLAALGFIDPSSGEILFSRAPRWQNFPLKTRLEAEVGLPVIIENDIDCMTYAELANDNISVKSNLLYLGFAEGVKVSLILDGRLYKGPFGNAGVLGLTTLTHSDLVDDPEKEIHLQDIASVGGACRVFDHRVSTSTTLSAALREISELNNHLEKFQAILNSADSEPICYEIVSEIINILSTEISKLIIVLQPSLLIVGGALSRMPPGLKTDMENSIRGKLPSLISNHLLIKYAAMVGSRVAAVGAIFRFLERYDIE